MWTRDQDPPQEEAAMTLTLISVGLNSHYDMSLRALEAARQSSKVYVETYTMKLDTNPEKLSRLIGKNVEPLIRGALEEDSDRIIDEASNADVAVLVGGDALTATTHISVLIDATKRGVKTKVIHGSSIITAVAETGLSLYKFGKTVTIPLPEKGPVDTVIKTIKENQEYDLHTLVLLDLNIPESRFLLIPQALQRLVKAGFPEDSLVVGVARLGSDKSLVKADKALNLSRIDFGGPPQALIVPGLLHFQEEEGLKTLAGCPPELLEERKVQGEVEILIDKYSASCRRVLEEMKIQDLPKEIHAGDVRGLLDHASRYLDDAEYYRTEQKPVALTSVAYAEGILDALKLLHLAEFEW
jgi:diphthine synthase